MACGTSGYTVTFGGTGTTVFKSATTGTSAGLSQDGSGTLTSPHHQAFNIGTVVTGGTLQLGTATVGNGADRFHQYPNQRSHRRVGLQ